MRIAGVQMDVQFGEVNANRDVILEKFHAACDQGAQLVVFPECALTGYCFESFDEAVPVAETIPGPSSESLRQACRSRGTHVIYGLIERDGERLFNACSLVGPDGLVGSYRKIHLPHLGIDRFAAPGDRPFDVWDIGDLRIGMNICYDGSFPESSRVMALNGADLIALPTAWPPGAETTAEHAVPTRAIENKVFYIAVNRVGTERGFAFIGQSQICGVEGHRLAAARHKEEEILIADIDVAHARDKRIERVPGKHAIDRFADRRVEMYGRIGEK